MFSSFFNVTLPLIQTISNTILPFLYIFLLFASFKEKELFKFFVVFNLLLLILKPSFSGNVNVILPLTVFVNNDAGNTEKTASILPFTDFR